jgi:pimeloyl-ACP methyl ester carboxylesterase
MPHAAVNGIELAWDRFGRDTDPALLLIMGFSMQMTAWPEAFCERLAAGGLQVIRFDNRDIGLSSRLTHLGEPNVRRMAFSRLWGFPQNPPYRIADMADDAVGLLDVLGIERAHVVGASMGGMIAQRLAIHHPQRVRTLTSIMSTTGQLRYAMPQPSLMQMMLAPPPAPDLEARIRYGVAFWRAVSSPGDPPTEDELIRDIRAWFERSPDLSGRTRQLAAILAEPSRARELRRVECPALVVHGEDDPLIPCAAGRATARALPRGRFLPLAGMGHDLRPGYLETMAREIVALAGSRRDPG